MSGNFINFTQTAPSEKHSTCIFRSKDMVVRRSCCKGTTTGYECVKRKIFPVVPEVCFGCNIFQAK
jgi:hypothetical protein